MAMKRRLRIALWVLAVSVVLMVVLLFVGWRFYKVYRSPERFIAMGRELVESGEQKAAMDQYRRALRYTRTAEKRADVLREMAKSLKEQGPLPVEEALENYRSLMSVWASIARVDRTDQATREKLLDAHYRIARQSGAAWAWRNLFEVAQMMERLDDESLLARKYLTIAKLRVDDGQTDGAVFYDEINEELRELRDLHPDDVDLPYYLSVSDLTQASTVEGSSYLPLRGQKLARRALGRMAEFAEAHPDSVDAKIAYLKVLVRGSWLLKEYDKLETAFSLVDSLETAMGEQTATAYQARETAHLVSLVGNLAARARQDGAEDVRAFDRGDTLVRAERILRKALKENGNRLPLLLRLSVNLREQGKDEQALSTLRAMLEDQDIPLDDGAIIAWNTQLHARFLLADIMLKGIENAEDEKARKSILASVRELLNDMEDYVDQESPYVELLEGRIAYHRGDYRIAVRKLADAEEKLGRKTPEAMLFSGLGLARLGETGAALRKLAEFLSTPGTNPEQRERAWLEMASCAVRLRDFDRAVKIGRKLLENDPEDVEANLLLGRALVLQLLTGRVTEKEQVFSEVITLLEPLAKKGNSLALRQLAKSYDLAGNWAKARELLVEYCRNNSDDATALVHLYRGLMRAGQTEAAKEWMRKALSTLPESEAVSLVRKALEGDSLLTPKLNRLLQIALLEDKTGQLVRLYAFYKEIGRVDDAERVLADAVALSSNDAGVLEAQFNRALAAKRFEHAETIVARFSAGPGDPPDVELWNARLEMARGENTRAIKRLEASLDQDPSRSMAWTLLGSAYRESGDLYKAEENLRKALELKPDQTRALRQLIQVSAERGLHHQVLQYMRRALTFTPSDRQLLTSFLGYLDQHGSTDEALEMRLQLAGRYPDDYDNRRAIARLYLKARQPQRAKAVLEKLLEEQPNDFRNEIAIAGVLAAVGQGDAANKRLQEVLEEMGDDATVSHWLMFADFLLRQGNADEAIAKVRQAVPLEDPERMSASRYLADVFLRVGRSDKAVAAFRTILEKTGHADARLGLAEAAMQSNDQEEALKQIERLERDNFESARLFRIKAISLQATGQNEAARESIEKAIELAPGNALGLLYRARILSNTAGMEDDDQIGEDLGRALEIRPNLTQARILLANWYARNDRSSEAIAEVQRLTGRYPGERRFKSMLLRLYLSAGQFDRMEQFLREWEEQAPDEPLIDRFFARLAQARGDVPEAVERWRAVVERNPVAENLLQYLRVLVDAGRAAEAVTTVEANSDKLPGNPAFLALYARALALTDQAEKARETFRRALFESGADYNMLSGVIEEARKVLSPEDLLPMLAKSMTDDQTHLISLVVGQLYTHKGDLEVGIRRLESLREKTEPNSPIRGRLLVTLGTAYSQGGRNQKAKETYRAALDIMPDDPVLLNNLAYAMATDGDDPYRAVKLAQRAADLGKSSTKAQAYYLDTLGFTQCKAELAFHARQTLERSVGLEPMPANTMHLGQAYMAEGKLEEAEQSLKRSLSLAKAIEDSQYLPEIKETIKRLEALKKEQQQDGE